MQSFYTQRLHMRRLVQSDEALYCSLYTDADTMRYIAPPVSPERALRAFRKVLAWSDDQPSTPQYFAIIEKQSQRAIGLCATQAVDATILSVEVGMILKSDARMQGYATEGLAALVDVAFAALPTDAVWVQYPPEHTAAERLVVGIGFTPNACRGGNNADALAQCIWSVHRSSWCDINVVNQMGEDNVQRHQLS